MFKRLSALFLSGALALSLAACTTPAAVENTEDPAGSSAPPSPSVSAPAPSGSAAGPTEDVPLRVAGIPADAAVLTVDGQPISAEVYLYWLSYTTSYYNSYVESYGESIVWDEEVDGTTLSDYLKADAVDAAKFYHLLGARAKAMDCDLTEEQEAELLLTEAETIAASGGEEEYSYNLRLAGISSAALNEINRAYYYYNNLSGRLMSGDNAPTDAQLAEYADLQGTLWAKHILFRTVDDAYAPLSEEAVAAARTLAEDVLAQIHASDDPVATFNELMHQHSEDPGLISFPDGYSFGPGEMVSAFETEARSLTIGAISTELVESEFGYHILLRMPPSFDDALRAEYADASFRTVLDTWMNEAAVEYTPEFEGIDPQSVFEEMERYRAEIEAEHTEAHDHN